MNGVILNTDPDWYHFFREKQGLEEVNFWQPNRGRPINTIPRFGPLIFRLTHRRSRTAVREQAGRICGYGFYASHQRFLAGAVWELFRESNGAATREEFLENLRALRSSETTGPPESWLMGCVLIATPVFLDPALLVDAPADWHPRYQQGMTYDLAVGEGRRVWEQVRDAAGVATPPLAYESALGGYQERVTKVRIGQRIFRAEVLVAYRGACAVTREHSLPVVEAAHIVPFAERQVHDVANGLALRSDLHRLFDAHYLTFDEDHRLVVSRRLREDYSNGKAYYQMQEQGARLHLPDRPEFRPDRALLDIHRERFARLAG